MTLVTQEEKGFQLGMIQDEPSQLIPPGGVYYASNFLFDKQHMARKRGGTTALSGLGSITFTGQYLGALYADSQTLTGSATLRRVYTSRAQGGTRFDVWSTLGGANQLATSTVGGGGVVSSPSGRPFQHTRFLLFPGQTGSAIAEGPAFVAGADTTGTNTVAAHPASASVTAGNSTITIGGGDLTTNYRAGMVAVIESATWSYVGAIVAIPSTTTFVVDPVPTQTFTPTGVTVMQYSFMANTSVNVNKTYQAGRVGCSWQQRIIWADISRFNGTTGVKERRSNRIIYSTLPGEANPFSTTAGCIGAVYLTNDGYPDLNYIDLPAQEQIIALVPIPTGDLLIFSQTSIYRLTGTLVTQTATTGGGQVTFDLRLVAQGFGAVSERSVQQTTRGVVFATANGIYAFSGNSIVNLMEDRVQSIWRTQPSGGTVYGSAVVRDHYIIYASCIPLALANMPRFQSQAGQVPSGLMVNLNTLAWGGIAAATTTQGNVCMMFDSVVSPNDPTLILGLRQWDTTGAAPADTGGQVVRLDTIFQPSATNITDSNGVSVLACMQSRSLNLDAYASQVLWRRGHVRVNLDQTVTNTSASVEALFQVRSDISTGYTAGAGATPQAVKQLSTTIPLLVTNATNATPIVVTIGGVTFTGIQNEWIQVTGVTGNTAANGIWPVAASGSNTFSLTGSSGNGAFGGTNPYVILSNTPVIELNQLPEGPAIDVIVLAFNAVAVLEVFGIAVQGLLRHPVGAS